MLKATRLIPALLAASVSLASAACADTIYTQRYPYENRDNRVYYDRGVRDGRDSGVDDARRGRSYDLRRHGEYRDDRRGDDPGDLRAYRTGFESGYDEGYRQYSRTVYGDSRRNYPAPPPLYPSQQYPNYGGQGRYSSPAAATGYRDGFDEGQHAARDGDRFDPVREKRYRDGDHDYDKRYGSKDEYQREYRAAFQQGYDAGYRGYRY
jgi:hypothetical protein